MILNKVRMMKGNAWTRISDQFPTSCKDYFNRDNLFAGASIAVPVEVTIDPDGPGTAGSAVVNCVKTSSTEVCTRVSRQQSLYRDLIFLSEMHVHDAYLFTVQTV